MPRESGKTGGIVIYTLLSLILVFIVFYIIWKATKSKRIKRKMEKIEKKKAEDTLELYYEFILTYNLIIDFTLNELNKFYNNNTDKKMTQIKVGAKKLLLKLISREDFAAFFHGDEKYKLFVENAELLTVTQANLWDKKISSVIEFFKEQFNSVPDDDKKTKIIDLATKSIMEQYYEEKN